MVETHVRANSHIVNWSKERDQGPSVLLEDILIIYIHPISPHLFKVYITSQFCHLGDKAFGRHSPSKISTPPWVAFSHTCGKTWYSAKCLRRASESL
jgi:hypothetical protein